MEREEELSSKDIWLLEDKELVVMNFQNGINQALQAVKFQSQIGGRIVSLNGQLGRRCSSPKVHVRK